MNERSFIILDTALQSGVKKVDKNDSAPKLAQEKLRARRLMIVTAAVHCFIEKGYHQSGVRDIAAKAGVSLGNLYNHFKSKDEILYEITKIEAEELDEFREILSHAEDPQTSFENFVWAYLDYAARPENALMALEILSVAVRNPPIASGFTRNRAALIASLVDVLQAGSETGAFVQHQNAAETAKLVLDLIEGLAVRSVMSEASPSKDARDAVWGILKRSILAADSAKSQVRERR
ncbi:TetR/AcrR family transcriptional regulator [Pseudophaeobacter arcticus]|jgi:TetR/AcrR family transcriptional repressor of uid operon|uniref:TetR/AcrR family transcriptional regulator n=1 Tax=Pseudophaeobacter arcticus TaxID=385492 RepID=UPI0039E5B91F